MGSVRRRVEALERISAPQEFPGWPVPEQVEEAVDKLFFYQKHHADGRVRYAATDREITMLGIAHAWEELQGDGEIRLPHSGTAIRYLQDGEDTFSMSVDGVVVVEGSARRRARIFQEDGPQRATRKGPASL